MGYKYPIPRKRTDFYEVIIIVGTIRTQYDERLIEIQRLIGKKIHFFAPGFCTCQSAYNGSVFLNSASINLLTNPMGGVLGVESESDSALR